MATDKKNNPHIENMDAEAHAKASMYIKRSYKAYAAGTSKKRKEKSTLDEASEWAALVKKHDIKLGRPATREDLEFWRDHGDDMQELPF